MDAAERRIAEVGGTRILVVAIRRHRSQALFFAAHVHQGALIAIVARSFVRRVHASIYRVTQVVRAQIVVVAEQRGARNAETCRALVAGRANAAVITGRALQLIVFAGAVRVAAVSGAGIAIVAEPFIGQTVAIVVLIVADLRRLFDVAGRKARGFTLTRAFARAWRRRLVARGLRLQFHGARIAFARLATLGYALQERPGIIRELVASVSRGAVFGAFA